MYRFGVFFYFLADLLDLTGTENWTVLVKQFSAYPVSEKEHFLYAFIKN